MAQRPAFELLQDYERRSLAHVAGLPEQFDAPGQWRGLAYRVGERRLASMFDDVVEILPLPPITPVPGAQAWMLGVGNIRGNLLPVADLKLFLEGQRSVPQEQQRMLVIRQQGGNVGVLIDELHGQRSFDVGQGEPVPDATGRYHHFIEKAYRQQDTVWSVFSLDRLSRTPEFRQAAA